MNTFQLLWLQFLILLKKNLYVQKRNLLITILQVFERHTHRVAARVAATHRPLRRAAQFCRRVRGHRAAQFFRRPRARAAQFFRRPAPAPPAASQQLQVSPPLHLARSQVRGRGDPGSAPPTYS